MIEDKPVVVDMFCGSGGESQGIDWAAQKAGVRIDMYAINHWERAIETHRANFPTAEHICRDIQDINPSDVVPDRKVALMWASPACTHFSIARGGKPCDDQSRVTPFTILDWLIRTSGWTNEEIANALFSKRMDREIFMTNISKPKSDVTLEVRKAEKLAELLHRPLSALFLSKPPKERPLPKDHRGFRS